MIKKISILAALLMVFGLAACAAPAPQETSVTSGEVTSESTKESEVETSDTKEAPTEESSADATEDTTGSSKVLVVYFSATGNTRGVAEKIAGITGADTYEIKAEQEYSDADLNWNDSNSRSTKEQNDPSARPGIGGDSVSLEGYDRVYIGYPIWWGEEPRIMDTFVESHSFDGITMIPFCTSGGSGIGRSGKNLADNAGTGNWLDGKRFAAGASEDEIRTWIEGLQ